MARGKKDRQVGEIKHKSGVSVPLMFDPNDSLHSETGLTFSAQVGSETFRAKAAEEVRQSVVEYLDANLNLDWVPVIEVEETAPFNSSQGDYIGLDIERFYVARAGKAVKRLDWDDYEAHVTQVKRLQYAREFWGCNQDLQQDLRQSFPVSNRTRDEHHIWLAYDEPTWVALQRISAAIGQLKENLRTLLGSEPGRKRLVDFGEKMMRLLPPAQ